MSQSTHDPGSGAQASEIPSRHLPPVPYADLPEAEPLRKVLGPSVLLLAGAGLGAPGPSTGPIMVRVLAGLIALILGAGMAFCGAHFAARRV